MSRYRELFRRASKDIFDSGLKVHERKQNELAAYDTAIKEEQDKVQFEGNRLAYNFLLIIYNYTNSQNFLRPNFHSLFA